MSAAGFELNVRLPPDARFAGTMRDLAAHAARFAGCGEEDAAAYGRAVEEIALACLGQAAQGSQVPIIVRRDRGPVEFLIGCEEGFDPGACPDPIAVGRTRERGASMCRVTVDP